jgi:hypothetical protein
VTPRSSPVDRALSIELRTTRLVLRITSFREAEARVDDVMRNRAHFAR